MLVGDVDSDGSSAFGCCVSDLLSTLEYRSLLQLLCPDFPAEVVQNAARSVLHQRARLQARPRL